MKKIVLFVLSLVALPMFAQSAPYPSALFDTPMPTNSIPKVEAPQQGQGGQNHFGASNLGDNGSALTYNGLPASITANRFSKHGVTMFGDSITFGAGATATEYDYGSLLQGAYGAPYNNYAVSGDQAADQVNNQIYVHLNPLRYGNVPDTIMIGVNDANICGATTGCENNYFHTLLSGVAWATIPYEFKIQPQQGITAGNCTTTGTWTNTTYGNVSALSSIVPGSTLTCTSFTAGDAAVYANWFASDSLTSTATFSIDGAQVDTWNAFGFNGQIIHTNNGTTQTAFATRYPLAGAGSHTYKVTVGTAGTSNAFTVLWIGSPAPLAAINLGGQTQDAPRMAVAGVIRQQADAKSAVTAAFNALALSVPAQLGADGAIAIPVNVRAYVGLDYATLDSDMSPATLPNGLVTPTSSNPGVHPNGGISNGIIVGGHRHLADAFLATMPPVPVVCSACVASIPNTAWSSTASTGFITLFSTVAQGSYRLCGYIFVNAVGTAGTVQLDTNYTGNGTAITPVTIAAVSATTSHTWGNGCSEFTADAASSIQYNLLLGGVTGTPTFNYWVTLERLQ